MVTATRTEQKMVTGTINGQEVTVPAGTVILEAARMAGIEIPNLCFQPLLRAWGSCRICTVEILGKRGGLIESCATPLTDGMEVLTHSPDVMQARQFILQMYLIDHASGLPDVRQVRRVLPPGQHLPHNIHANPYRRPKFAQPYTHFSELIDYKWDRCIMCNRCTRVCDEVIGVTAIEGAYRSLEATIAPAYGADLTETLCTSCGMCIAVCPVGALTDRHFGLHPWELDTTETICGFCDVGCTLNVEANRGLVRRVTNLWELLGAYGFDRDVDPTRVVAQIVTGVGFLGAGVIMKQGSSVVGLNTAATLWATAAVGALAGAWAWREAVAGAVIIIAANGFLYPLAARMDRLHSEVGREVQATDYTLEVECERNAAPDVRSMIIDVLTGPAMRLKSLGWRDAETHPAGGVERRCFGGHTE